MTDTPKPINDGGSAFPMLWNAAHNSAWLIEQGMSLRDYFAAQALHGFMSDAGMRPASTAEIEHMAWRLYQVADAMLAARQIGGAA